MSGPGDRTRETILLIRLDGVSRRTEDRRGKGALVPTDRNDDEERHARLYRLIEETRIKSEALTKDARELGRRTKARMRQAKADLTKPAGARKRRSR